jgi:hypothetical protein
LLAKVDEINLESVSPVLREDWLSAALLILCHWVFLHAYKASGAIELDMVLGDIGVLVSAILPSPLLT